MSHRMAVLLAVKQLIADAVPAATVKGLDADAPAPTRPTPGGLVIIRYGSPGAPEVDLSPLAYNYEHRITVEVSGGNGTTGATFELVDGLIADIGAAIEADRNLGGLCMWLDAEAPEIDELRGDGTPAVAGAVLTIIASYTTSNPLF